MIKIYKLLIVLLVFVQFTQAQDQAWKSYFSFNNITAIVETKDGIISASQNALFSQNEIINELQQITTLDGLSGNTISALYHNESVDKTFIGYANGLIQVIIDDDVVDLVDVKLKSNISPDKKAINDFYEHEGLLYVSCDFGIVVIDIEKLLIKETYFIGQNGLETEVTQAVIYDNILYAATLNQGIKSISLDNNAKVDYKQWYEYIQGFYTGVNIFNDVLVISTADNRLISFDWIDFKAVMAASSTLLTTFATDEHLLVVSAKEVVVYDSNFQVIKTFDSGENTEYTDAIIKNNTLYISTKEEGVLVYDLNSNALQKTILPKGPIRNVVFSMTSTSNGLWAVYGDHDSGYNPFPTDKYGISYLNYENENWREIKYESLEGAESIVRVTVDPKDENHVYFSSYVSGLLEMKEGGINQLYDHTNSQLETLTDKYRDVRINGAAFDSDGNLWLNNSFIQSGLKKLNPEGEWESFILDQEPKFDTSYAGLIIDKNNTKWIASNTDGLIGFNEEVSSTPKQLKEGAGAGNLPINDVRTMALDANNQLWIGTAKGLRILNNTKSFLTDDQLTSQSIIILDDGLAQELLFEQFISDIVVDGANRKWIATAGSGLFYLSSNGQKTIHHFTNSNSPLPSDDIINLEMNGDTGELFIATDKGMVSFNSEVTASTNALNDVLVYPNPVRPGYEGTIKIKGLQDQSNVKISDITGNLVHQATAEGGTVVWDGRYFGKQKVASGVYMVFISTPKGKTEVKKIMIVR